MNSRIYARLKSVCLTVVIISVVLQCFYYPIIGIANNGDFERLSRRVGIKPIDNAWEDENYDNYFWNYVVQYYDYGEPQETNFSSTAAYVVSLSKYISPFNTPYLYDIRSMGFINGILYVLGIYLILRCVRFTNSLSNIVLGAGLTLLACDRYIIQFFNSFYEESVAIAILPIMVGTFVLYLKTTKIFQKLVWLIIQMATLLMFIGCKFQNILVVFPLTVILILEALQLIGNILKNKPEKTRLFAKTLISLLVVILMLGSAGKILIENMNTANNATSANIILKDLLRYSQHPQLHLSSMGFTEEEIDGIIPQIGNTIFTVPKEFVEKYNMNKFSRSNELKILFREPRLLFICLQEKGNLLFREIDNLGNFVKDAGYAPRAHSTFFTLFSRVGFLMLPHSFLFFFLVLLFVIIIELKDIIQHHKFYEPSIHHFMIALAAGNILLFLTVAFGDSSFDNIKQFIIVNILFFGLFIWLIYRLISKLKIADLSKTNK